MGKRIDKDDFKVIDLTVDDIEQKLREFEAKFKMDSKDFYRKYNRGELKESSDFMDWATFFEMVARKGTRRLTAV